MNANSEINNFTNNTTNTPSENQLDTESLLNETLECLNKTFSEKNNAIRMKAERRLAELGKNFF